MAIPQELFAVGELVYFDLADKAGRFTQALTNIISDFGAGPFPVVGVKQADTPNPLHPQLVTILISEVPRIEMKTSGLWLKHARH